MKIVEPKVEFIVAHLHGQVIELGLEIAINQRIRLVKVRMKGYSIKLLNNTITIRWWNMVVSRYELLRIEPCLHRLLDIDTSRSVLNPHDIVITPRTNLMVMFSLLNHTILFSVVNHGRTWKQACTISEGAYITLLEQK
jgi:hypothetical protein